MTPASATGGGCSIGFRHTAAIWFALAALALGCQSEPAAPVNRPPIVDSLSLTSPAYPDEPIVATYRIRDPDGSPIAAIERRWYVGDRLLHIYNDKDTLPAGIVLDGAPMSFSVRAFDGKDWSEQRKASVIVSAIPFVTASGRLVYYLDSTAAAGNVVRFGYKTTREPQLDTTDQAGRFSLTIDRRKVGTNAELFVWGDATPLGGRRFHDYRDSVPMPFASEQDLRTLLLINYYVSPGGRGALPRWKRLTGNDGTGLSTLNECWQNYPVSYFLNADTSTAGTWPDSIRRSMDDLNALAGQVGTEVSTRPLGGVLYEYFTEVDKNQYDVLEWANPELSVPKLVRIGLQGGNTSIGSRRTSLHEGGHVYFCLWAEDVDGVFPLDPGNPESIMGASNTLTALDQNYARLSRRLPYRYDVKRHLDTSTRF